MPMPLRIVIFSVVVSLSADCFETCFLLGVTWVGSKVDSLWGLHPRVGAVECPLKFATPRKVWSELYFPCAEKDSARLYFAIAMFRNTAALSRARPTPHNHSAPSNPSDHDPAART